MIDRTLHSANLLVAMAGLVTASGPVAAIGSAVSGALSARDLSRSLPREARPLADEIHRLLDTALANAHLGPSDRKLIPQMIEASIPDADTIVAAGKDPARILDAMEAKLDGGDPAHASPVLRQCFRDALTPALERLMRDGAIAEGLQAAFQTQVLALMQEQTARLAALIAQTGDKARELHLTEQLFIGLARRVSRRIDNIDDAHKELEAAVDRAAEMDRQAQLPSNLGAQVDAVLAEVARLNAEADFDGAGRLIDAELAKADAHKSRLLTLAIDQSLLQLDAESAARHLIARADLEAGGRAAFADLRALRDAWYKRGRDKGIRLDLQVSVALARQVLARATDGDESGAARNDLAVALADLGRQSGETDLLDQAVAAYRAALTELTRDRVPLQWAMTQMNLGTALSSLGERKGDADLLDQAVAAYREALEEQTRDRVPLDWAMTQMNLGNALRSLGERRGDADLLDQAVAAYRKALTERTRDRVPLDWAMTQMGLGNALRILGERRGDADVLDQAVAAYRAALTEWTRDRVPLQWATTQMNLGTALSSLGRCKGDADLLDQAVAAYRAALTEGTRARVPLDWATTQMNLGVALGSLGDGRGDADLLGQAVAAYREALTERTRDRVPLDWAMTQVNLGTALSLLGERKGNADLLDQAVAAYREALTEWTRDRVPLQWATTQANLATVERARFGLTRDATHLDAAQGYLEAARGVFAAHGADGYLAIAAEIQAGIDACRG